MLGFLLRRLGILIPTFLGVSFLAFMFIRVLPGDPILLLAGERGIKAERYQELLHRYGFDRSIVEQYGIYLRQLLQGDLGVSIVTKKSVLAEFLTLFPATLELSHLCDDHCDRYRRAGGRHRGGAARLACSTTA